MNAKSKRGNKTQTLQQLLQTVTNHSASFRTHLDEVGNIRQMLSFQECENLMKDIDVLQPLFHTIAELAYSHSLYEAIADAHQIGELFSNLELELVLLTEEVGAKKTRTLLELQQRVKRIGADILEEIASLKRALHAELRQAPQHIHSALSLVESNDVAGNETQ